MLCSITAYCSLFQSIRLILSEHFLMLIDHIKTILVAEHMVAFFVKQTKKIPFSNNIIGHKEDKSASRAPVAGAELN